jgi:hypothetical protein
MFYRIARIALAAVLLVAWQAALQHPIEHVNVLGEFVHVHSGHPDENQSGAGSLCDLLATLTACAAPTQTVFGSFQSDYDSLSYPSSAPRAAEAPPFLSQGPPAPV